MRVLLHTIYLPAWSKPNKNILNYFHRSCIFRDPLMAFLNEDRTVIFVVMWELLLIHVVMTTAAHESRYNNGWCQTRFSFYQEVVLSNNSQSLTWHQLASVVINTCNLPIAICPRLQLEFLCKAITLYYSFQIHYFKTFF